MNQVLEIQNIPLFLYTAVRVYFIRNLKQFGNVFAEFFVACQCILMAYMTYIKINYLSRIYMLLGNYI